MKNIIKDTDFVPIYTYTGEKINEIRLPQKIMPIPSKRGGFSRNGIYYKGCGIVYKNHLTNEMTNGLKFIGKTRIIYEQYLVCYPRLIDIFGIFTFPHQAIFTDCEGGCGKKEQKLLDNQKIFKLSAIEDIVNVIPTGISDHNIYAYTLKKVKGSIEDTVSLIEYILTSDFNTAWDKNLWGDIYCFGYVHDIADWFISDKLNHKIGTIYALLNSLYRADLSLYAQLLLKYFGIYSFEKYKILYYSALIVENYCHKLFENENIDLKILNEETYEKLLTLLFSGKACCHLENEEKWNWVNGYLDILKNKHMLKVKDKLL